MDRQQIHITQVALAGYRSVISLECTFKSGINIIIGDNGSGKSNFFDFLDNCFRSESGDIYDFSAKVTLSTGKVLSWENVAHNVVMEPPMRYGYAAKESGNLPFRYEYIRFSIPLKMMVLDAELPVRIDTRKKKVLSITNDKEGPSFIRNVFYKLIIQAFEKCAEVSEECFYTELNSLFDETYQSFKTNVLAYSPVEDIRMGTSLRFARISEDVSEVRNILLEYKVNGGWYSWNALSDGTKRIIYLIGTLCGYKDGDQTFAPDIIFIEEPEIGIHPHQLHLLLNFLRERSLSQQILISTHSPQVLDVLNVDELDNVIIAEITPKEGTLFRHLTKDEQDKATFYFKDEGLLSEYWRFSDLQRTKKI